MWLKCEQFAGLEKVVALNMLMSIDYRHDIDQVHKLVPGPSIIGVTDKTPVSVEVLIPNDDPFVCTLMCIKSGDGVYIDEDMFDTQVTEHVNKLQDIKVNRLSCITMDMLKLMCRSCKFVDLVFDAEEIYLMDLPDGFKTKWIKYVESRDDLLEDVERLI